MRSRSKIIAATMDVIARDGFDSVTIVAVAEAAAVTRQTVYSIFGTREVLITETMSRVAEDALSYITTHVNDDANIHSFVVEWLVAARYVAKNHGVLARLLSVEASNPIFDRSIVQAAQPFIRAVLTPVAERERIADRDLDDIVNITIRLGLSIFLFDDPATRSDEQLRAFLSRWLPPTMNTPE